MFFFVISGYVVTASLATSTAYSFGAFISEFYARRLARILPALVLVLVVSALAATAFIPPAWLSGVSEVTARRAFFGLSNLVLQNNADTYFSPRTEFNPYTHTWSLGVEEQFYVVAPLLVYLWVRASRRSNPVASRTVLALLALLTLASLAFCIWATESQPRLAFYSIVCRLWELALGALLCIIPLSSDRLKPGPAILWKTWMQTGTAVGAVLAIGSSFIWASTARFPWPWAVLPVLGTLLLIGGPKTVPIDAVRRTLAAQPAVWIGKRSYSLYLWHWPVYVLMRWTVGLENGWQYLVAIAATFGLAIASFRWIEQPLRHQALMERRPRCFRITSFALLALAGWFATNQMFDHRDRFSLSRVARAPIDWYASDHMVYSNVGNRQCQVNIERQPVAGGTEFDYPPVACSMGNPAVKSLHVLGDSHAGALSGVYEQLSAEQGIAAHVYSFPGCPYVDLRMPMEVSRPEGCLEFSRAVLARVVATSHPGDVVLLSSLRMQRYGDQWASFNVPDMAALMYSPDALKLRTAALEDARQWLQPLTDAHLKVVFTAPTPVFKAPPFRCSDWFNATNPICVGQNRQPRADLEALRKPVLEDMHRLMQTIPGISIWDAFPVLCPGETCVTEANDRPLFFDGDHLSAYGNFWIYPSFRQFFATLN